MGVLQALGIADAQSTGLGIAIFNRLVLVLLVLQTSSE